MALSSSGLYDVHLGLLDQLGVVCCVGVPFCVQGVLGGPHGVHQRLHGTSAVDHGAACNQGSHTYLYIYIHTHTHITYLYVYMYVYTYVHMYICLYVHMYICVRASVCVCIYIDTYVYRYLLVIDATSTPPTALQDTSSTIDRDQNTFNGGTLRVGVGKQQSRSLTLEVKGAIYTYIQVYIYIHMQLYSRCQKVLT